MRLRRSYLLGGMPYRRTTNPTASKPSRRARMVPRRGDSPRHIVLASSPATGGHRGSDGMPPWNGEASEWF